MLMRLIQAFPACVMSVLIVGCAASPSAHADTPYGPGTYSVPGQLPYGSYTAQGDMRDVNSGCSYSLWTSSGKFISVSPPKKVM